MIPNQEGNSTVSFYTYTDDRYTMLSCMVGAFNVFTVYTRPFQQVCFLVTTCVLQPSLKLLTPPVGRPLQCTYWLLVGRIPLGTFTTVYNSAP